MGKSKMAAIATNMAFKIAANGESKRATVNKQNGHEYGNWKGTLPIIAHFSPILSRILGLRANFMVNYLYTKLCKNAFLTALNIKNHPESAIAGDSVKIIINHIYSKNKKLIMTLATTDAQSFQSKGEGV